MPSMGDKHKILRLPPPQEGKRQREDAATPFTTIPVKMMFPPRSCWSSQPTRDGDAKEMGSFPESRLLPPSSSPSIKP